MSVTNLQDAKAFRSMGVPLNTPVVDGGELPKSTGKAMEAGFKAAIAFRERIFAYCDNQTVSTANAMARSYERFMQKASPDDELAAAILDSEFGEVREQWSVNFELLYAGKSIQVSSQIWPWVPTEATKRRLANPER